MLQRLGLSGSLALGVCLMALPALAVPDTSVAAMSGNLATSPEVAQVSSVSELTDVDPNSWAFQALKSLVDRYGCIEGYPSKKYLGNRPLSRYEFAAGLNACLDKIGEQIAASTEPLVAKEDLAPLQRLQERFKEELSIMRGEIDGLEAKTAELEAQQFSTTTKLDGETIFAIAGANAGNSVRTNNTVGGPSIDGGSQNVIFGTRTRLNFRAKNLGTEGDELRIRLTATTDGGSFFGTNTGTNDVRVGRLDYLGPGTTLTNGRAPVSFDKVYYEFPLFSKDFKVRIGPRLENEDVLGLQPNTRDQNTQFSLRGFKRNIGMALVGTSVPAVSANWKLSDQWKLAAYYGALAGGDSFGSGSGGVTGPSQAAVEIGYKPDKTLDIGLGYYRTVCNPINAALSTDSNPATPANDGESPGSQNRIFCGADSGGSSFYPFSGNFGGVPSISNVQHDTFNFHADWEFAPDISLFGRYSFGTANITDGIAANAVGANLNYNEWMAGLAFNNTFGRKGDSLGIAVLQPANITSNSSANVAETFPSGTFPASSTTPNATEYNYGFYYRYTLTKNFTVGPEVYLITNPGSIAGNPTVTQAIFRALYKY
jgi:Carbohydrate-selective porin, OprB family/S-layer homology domain